MILALDISTSVIGFAIFGEDYKLHEVSYLKFKKGTNLFIKLDEFIEHFEKYSNINFIEICIEESMKKFAGRFSSADTIQKLTQINAMISGYLYRKLNIEPAYYNVSAARKLAFPNLTIPQKHPNKKYLIWECVMKTFPTLNWNYTKGGKLTDESFDMSDAVTIGLAHIVSKIRQKNSTIINKKMNNIDITGISLTDVSAFVITFRNQDNSEFYIRPKSDFERELEIGTGGFVYSAMNEGIKIEKQIVEMIEAGIQFYTYNYTDKSFTAVIVASGQIKSKANNAEEDNIGKLPLFSINEKKIV